jgi:hypothetical protein
VAVGVRRAGAVLVEGLEGAGEEEDRGGAERGVALDRLAELVPVPPRHHDVGEHDVRLELARLRERLLAVVHRGDAEVLVGEDDSHDLLDGDRVVREKKVLGHGAPPPLEKEDRIQ